MSALEEFGSDVNMIVADLEAQFRVLNDKKRALSKQGSDLATGWATYLDNQARQMSVAQDALNRISNAPLSETPVKSSNGGGLSKVPPKVPIG